MEKCIQNRLRYFGGDVMFGIMFEKNAVKYVYRKLHSISNLKEQRISSDIKIDRKNVKICVVDDEGFDIDKVYSLGYIQVDRKLKFESIGDYEKYNIILCDIEGVGNEFDSVRQGLAVAEQIKSVYPEKIVLIYSGKNVESYGELPTNIDGVLSKVEATTELVKKLDAYYKESIDPIIVWEKTRQQMLDSGIATKTIAIVEDQYCNSMLEKKDFLQFEEYDWQENHEAIEKYIKVLKNVIKLFIEGTE